MHTQVCLTLGPLSLMTALSLPEMTTPAQATTGPLCVVTKNICSLFSGRLRDAEFTEIPEKPAAKKYVWLGGKPVLQKNVPQNNRQHFNGKQISYTLSWSYMGEVFEVHFAGEKEAQDVLSLLEEIRAENFEKPENTGEHILSILKKKTFSELRGKGLCQLL